VARRAGSSRAAPCRLRRTPARSRDACRRSRFSRRNQRAVAWFGQEPPTRAGLRSVRICSCAARGSPGRGHEVNVARERRRCRPWQENRIPHARNRNAACSRISATRTVGGKFPVMRFGADRIAPIKRRAVAALGRLGQRQSMPRTSRSAEALDNAQAPQRWRAGNGSSRRISPRENVIRGHEENSKM